MENARATWSWSWLDSTAADIRYAVRGLRAQPGFTVLAVLSLALAIGANSAIFSFADALLLRPLPIENPAEVLDVTHTTPDNPFEGMSFPDYRDVREKTQSFTGLLAYRLTPVAAATVPSSPAQIRLAMLVSDNFFRGHARRSCDRPRVPAGGGECPRTAAGPHQLRTLARPVRAGRPRW